MRRPRRILALSAALVALAVVGCGGEDDDASGPLDEALSYMPAKAPFAVAIDTDLEGDQIEAVDSLLAKFPLGVESVEEALAQELAGGEENVDFEKDVKPLLGNPFVVGATDVASFTDDAEDDDFVAAIQVKDTDALDSLIDKTGPTEQGEQSGATVYEDDGTVFAVKDDMVIFAGSERAPDRVARACRRRRASRRGDLRAGSRRSPRERPGARVCRHRGDHRLGPGHARRAQGPVGERAARRSA